jgi:AcrR family transcriptional regulator
MPRLIDHDQRRDELAQAVWRIVTAKGIGALSIREVAAEAGVSAGSLRHLFPTREQLVIAAAEQMLLGVERRIRALPQDISPLHFAERALAQTLPLDDDRRTEFAVNLALVAEEPAVPALAGIRRQTYEDLRRLCRGLVGMLRPQDDTADLDRADLDDAARRLHVLVDGLGFHLFQTGEDDGWSLATLRAELRQLAAEPRPVSR